MPATLRQTEWYNENLERERTKRREYARWYRSKQPEKRLWQAAKDRARVNIIAFDIDISDVVIPTLCPILGKPLVAKTRYAPSLDRLRPELGYTKGNVWVISKQANVMKNDASVEELMEFAKWLNKLTLS